MSENYWDMLAEAAKAMDKVEACAECMQHWRTHGPRHYRAFRNVNECRECGIRTVEVVERAVLDWQYDHDPLKTLVKRMLEAYRAMHDPKTGLREILGNWKERLAAFERGEGRDPVQMRDEALDAKAKSVGMFLACLKELDLAVPGRAKEENA